MCQYLSIYFFSIFFFNRFFLEGNCWATPILLISWFINFNTLYFILTLICLIDVGSTWSPHCAFLKNVSSIEWMEPWLFVTFNIILKHIFLENFINFPQVFQKIWRNSLSILTVFINFINFLDCLTLPRYKETNDVSL